MRIAWFRHTAIDTRNPLDGTAALIDELQSVHEISVIVEANAHDFVWQELQHASDLCVFELDNTRAHQFSGDTFRTIRASCCSIASTS